MKPSAVRTLRDIHETIDPALYNSLMNIPFGVLGRTVSTPEHPSTSGIFRFWLSKEAAAARAIDIGSVVVACSDDNQELVFGAVNELNAYCDTGSFIQDYQDHGQGHPEQTQEATDTEVMVATCGVVRALSSKTRPVTRSQVFFPTSLGIQFAFGIVDAHGESVYHGAAIPVGIYENADGTIAPVCIDENYLVGPEAAHLNVSGISGLACKTSALEFCLKALLQKTSKNLGVVVFNVKSNDLLYLDQINPRLAADPWSHRVYQSLGLPIEPFAGARFFAPSHPRTRNSTQSLRELATESFKLDLQMLYEDLPSLFYASDWDNETQGAWYVIKAEIERGNIESYEGMITWIDKLLQLSGLTEWPRGFPSATWHKLKSDLRRFATQYRGLITEGSSGRDIPWDDLRRNQVFVIDMQMLSDGGQKLVFGHCIRAITNILESRSNRLEGVVLFVDELNKFAPKDQNTTLKSQLVDVTARGRSLGLVLFGAEQFASAIDKQIVENSSTFIFGRTESTELDTSHYSSLTGEMKAKVRMLPQGQLLVKFPKFPQPIFVKFPYPPCLPGDEFRVNGHDSAHHRHVNSQAHTRRSTDQKDNDPALAESLPIPNPSVPGMEAVESPPAGSGAPVRAAPGLLKRYESGEYEAVWSELTSLGPRVRQPEYFEEAQAVARATMRRARHNVELIVRRLDNMNYEFCARGVSSSAPESPKLMGAVKQMFQDLAAKGDHMRDRSVFIPPGAHDKALLDKFERQGIILPLSLRAWMEMVGRVDLTGSHPSLCFMQDFEPARAILAVKAGDRRIQYRIKKANTVIGRANVPGVDLAIGGDAQAVSKKHARIERDNDRFLVYDLGSTNGVQVNGLPVREKRALSNGDEITIGHTTIGFRYAAEEKNPTSNIFADPLAVLPTAESLRARAEAREASRTFGAFDVVISPFDADKAVANPNEQIEEGYSIHVPDASADGMLVGERHKTYFVDYLRIAFAWGGFPGWDRYKNQPLGEISALSEGLLPL